MGIKLISALAAGAIVFVISGGGASAKVADGTVSGYLFKNGSKVETEGIKVHVTCVDAVSGKTYNRNPKTSSTGLYSTSFSPNCPNGSQIQATASYDDASGSTTGTMGQSEDGFLDIDLVGVAVPEFGAVTAVGALGVVGGGLFYLRRRQNRAAT